jgi:hypothetical protein
MSFLLGVVDGIYAVYASGESCHSFSGGSTGEFGKSAMK